MIEIETSELITRCRAGDELAWEALVRRYQSRIYGLAYHYMSDAEEARDMAQEIFVRVFQRIDGCTDPERFQAWMLRIARNACIDRLRRLKVRTPGKMVSLDESIHVASWDPGPEEIWARDRHKQLIQQALRSMTALSREMIILKEMQDLSLEEISNLLNIPVGTVKSRANRARIELAKKVMTLTGGEPAPAEG